MKKTLIIAIAALALASCSPQIYPLQLEMRHPSSSGLSLNNKSMAIAYMKGGGQADALFSLTASSGLARTLEKDYFGGQEVIPIFQVEAGEVNKDVMLKYFMESGEDVLFLMSPPQFGTINLGRNTPNTGLVTSVDSAYICTATVPFTVQLYVFDSLEGVDTFHSYRGGSTIQIGVYNSGSLTSEGLMSEAKRQSAFHADRVGVQLGSSFVSTWKLEQYSLYYFEDLSTQDWLEPIQKAQKFNWIQAVDLWMPFVKSRDLQKAACASYNIAVAFYMTGDYELALKWLDQADKMDHLELSPSLRKRILERSGK